MAIHVVDLAFYTAAKAFNHAVASIPGRSLNSQMKHQTFPHKVFDTVHFHALISQCSRLEVLGFHTFPSRCIVDISSGNVTDFCSSNNICIFQLVARDTALPSAVE